MGKQLPEPLQILLTVLVGERWPSADEEKLRDAADVWKKLGSAITEAQQAADPAAQRILETQAGGSIDAFGEFWHQLCSDQIPAVARSCKENHAALRQYAGDVEATKDFIILQLEILAAEVALTLAAGGFTLGVSSAAAVAAATATRAVIRVALRELAEKAASATAHFAVHGAIDGVLNNATLQALRAIHGGSSFDARELFGAGLGGAVGGATAGMVTRSTGTGLQPNLASQLTGQAGADLAGNTTGSLTQAAVTGQEITANDLIGGIGRTAVTTAAAHHAEGTTPAAHPLPSAPSANSATTTSGSPTYIPGTITRALDGDNTTAPAAGQSPSADTAPPRPNRLPDTPDATATSIDDATQAARRTGSFHRESPSPAADPTQPSHRLETSGVSPQATAHQPPRLVHADNENPAHAAGAPDQPAPVHSASSSTTVGSTTSGEPAGPRDETATHGTAAQRSHPTLADTPSRTDPPPAHPTSVPSGSHSHNPSPAGPAPVAIPGERGPAAARLSHLAGHQLLPKGNEPQRPSRLDPERSPSADQDSARSEQAGQVSRSDADPPEHASSAQAARASTGSHPDSRTSAGEPSNAHIKQADGPPLSRIQKIFSQDGASHTASPAGSSGNARTDDHSNAPRDDNPLPPEQQFHAAAEQLRASAEHIRTITQLDGEHACTVHQVTFADGTRGLYKPASGEWKPPDDWKPELKREHAQAFPPGATTSREVAAFEVDALLQFGLVPATILWHGPHGPGSLQRHILNHLPGRHVGSYKSIDEARMAVLDYVIANTDRHSDNWLTAHDRPVAIDHGYAFPLVDIPILSHFVTDFFEYPLGSEVVAAVRSVSPDKLAERLRATQLEDTAIRGAVDRLAEIQRAGKITGEAWPGKIQNHDGGRIK